MNSSSPQKERTSTISRSGHNNTVACSGTQSPANGADQKPYKKLLVRYMECLKNHAAAIGGNATDGCGEFMPSGEEGTIEALKCLACDCHRNFHRKELECECAPSECHHCPAPIFNNGGRALIMGHQNHLVASSQGYPSASTFISIGAEPPHHHHQVIMPYKSGSAISESDEKEDGGGGVVAGPLEKLRKRFRTKFTQEQKEKMLNFAEKAGWRIQKLEESVVQQFCQEIGIKRRVLKVWMHNNKHSLAKKTPLVVEASNND